MKETVSVGQIQLSGEAEIDHGMSIGKIEIRSMSQQSMIFLTKGCETALKINQDGTVETGDIKPSEAAAVVIDAVKQMWGDAFRNAVMEEREACAQVADDMKGPMKWNDAIAATIRARGKEGT